jgi:tetratricopeptide (TPR) repeat protein
MKTALSALVVALAAGLLGCSSVKETAQTRQEPPKNTQLLERLKEYQRDRALARLVQGSVYDVTGDYASAILEYQEAIQLYPQAATYYAISKDYSALGKHALAAQHGAEAVRLDSLNILYHQNLAAIYLNAYQPDLALKEFERVVRIDSNNVEGLFNLARLYQPNQPLKALEIYERILDRTGDEWEILLQTAETYNSLGRFEDAAEKYKHMLELDPSNKVLQRQLAETYGRAGKFSEAQKLLEGILETDPKNAEALSSLADVYMEQHQYERALPMYQKLLLQERQNPEIRLRIAIAYVGQADRDSTFVDKAKPVFEQLTKDMPNDWRPCYYLGVIAARQSKDSVAREYFERVTHLAAWNGDAWWYLGSSYFEKGEYQKLIDAMLKAEKNLPKDNRMPFLLGLGYTRLDQNEAAIAALRRSLDLKPDDINTLSTLALTLDGLHRYQESDSLYERALKVDPRSHLVMNNYGYSLADRGLQLERALQMSLQAIEAEPNNDSYLDTVGWVYFKLGRYDEALKYISKAITAGGASATVYEHMGDIQYKLGEKKKAEQSWKQALEMNSANQTLKDKIARGSL